MNRKTRWIRVLVVGLGLGLLGGAVPVPSRAAEGPVPPIPTPAAGEILGTLERGHPRLFARRADFERLRAAVKTDPVLGAWWEKVRRNADGLEKATVVKYEIPDGLRLLYVSRRLLDRAYVLGFAWQMTGDRKYPEWLARDLVAVAAFPDWNPRHFLDTAEMSLGVAVAYDWCYDAWTPAQREEIRSALREKGLKPAQAAFRDAAAPGGWWPRAKHNWNQVCNGGVLAGALSVADEDTELAGELVAAAVRSIQRAMAEFAPDGAWAEGPAYWNYATVYNVVALAALETALGTDFGLSGIPGFAETGWFPIHVTGPLSRTFNYADGRDGALHAPQMFWLARKFNQPRFALEQKERATPHVLDLVWYDPALALAKPPPPLDHHFHGAHLVTMRSAWGPDSKALFAGKRSVFVGFKGGDNRANHGHLDLGSFVLDAAGVRWAMDLGAENYSVPGYFGAQRWDYYLTRAEGHNTLVLNPGSGPDQDPAATAPVTRFESRPDEAFAVVDLSAAYAKEAKRVQRGIRLLADRTQVLVQDEIEAERPAEAWWFLHTQAKVEAKGREATLTLGTNQLTATLVGAPGATFTVREAAPFPTSPQPKSQTLPAVRRLAIQFKDVRELRYAVRLVPAGAPAAAGAGAELVPLADWK